MDKYIKGVIAAFLACLILYFVFAFSAWSLNPNEWGEHARGFCAFLFLILAVVFAGLVPTIFYLEGK